MDRVTPKMLQGKVGYLTRRLGVDFHIDDYAPEGNPYRYQLYYHSYGTTSMIYTTNHRMTAKEFRSYLNGMIDCLDQFATAGV